MASTSEKSFAQRYTKARELVEYLEELPGYSPGVTELESSDLKSFLDDVDNANTNVASKLSALQSERDERFNLYKGTDGLIKRASQIRDYLASILPQGKKAKDYEKAQKIVQRMRGQRLTKKPPLNKDGSIPKTISTIEVSFGSILGVGKDLLEVIKTVPGYSPSNPNLTVANYTTYLASIDSKNSLVAEKYEQYDDAVEARLDKYAELKDRVTKIKLAIAAQYGKDSNQYKDAVKY